MAPSPDLVCRRVFQYSVPETQARSSVNMSSKAAVSLTAELRSYDRDGMSCKAHSIYPGPVPRKSSDTALEGEWIQGPRWTGMANVTRGQQAKGTGARNDRGQVASHLI